MKTPKNQLSNEAIKNQLETDLYSVSIRLDELLNTAGLTEVQRHEGSNLRGQQSAYVHALRLLGWVPPYMREETGKSSEWVRNYPAGRWTKALATQTLDNSEPQA